MELSKFCKTTELNQCLKLDSINTIYLKHKIYFYRQIMNNELASSVFNYLKSFYNEKVKAHVHSFVNQLEIVNKRIDVNDCTSDTEKVSKSLATQKNLKIKVS